MEDLEDNCSYFNVKKDEELIRLLVHGTLHLLGWDHTSNEDDEPMLIEQEKIVANIIKERG
jgi:probable rRNA maturation factor